jgi:hypothetical protein
MGFKSRRNPHNEVRLATGGRDCLLFARKGTSPGKFRRQPD